MDKLNPLLVGVCGGSGSGKSSLSKWIKNKFGEQNVLILQQDMYYKEGLSKDTNFDHPEAIDFELLIKDVEQLLKGKKINVPVYDFETSSRTKNTQPLSPKKIIVLEGILIYSSLALKNKLEYTIFVDADEEIRLARRTARDVKQRGRTIACVADQFLLQVKPMHNKFVEPYKDKVDFVFNSQQPQNMQKEKLKELTVFLEKYV